MQLPISSHFLLLTFRLKKSVAAMKTSEIRNIKEKCEKNNGTKFMKFMNEIEINSTVRDCCYKKRSRFNNVNIFQRV